MQTEQNHAEKASVSHWDEVWHSMPRLRLPSRLNVGILNLERILARHVREGDTVLEIGCAPGKILAWVAACLGASPSGLDYSTRGLEFSRRLMGALGIGADLRCESVFETTFPEGRFDVVYSLGVIEHFEDPREIVRRHVLLTRPGGKILITVPNYGGIYGRLERWFSPQVLDIHNTDIMSPEALLQLVPPDLVGSARAYPSGRLSPWLIDFDRRWPPLIARSTSYALNALGLLMPIDVGRLAPALVLEMTRKPAVAGA